MEGKREEGVREEVRGVLRLKILGKGVGSGSQWGLIALLLLAYLYVSV